MDFSAPFLPASLVWLSSFLAVIGLAAVATRTNWQKLSGEGKSVRLLSTVLALALLWMLRASLDSGISMHLLGTMLITLLFGWRLGVLGMSLVCVLVCLWGNLSPANLALAILLYAFAGVSFCYGLFLVMEARMQRHLFIYLYVTAFFGAALNYALLGTLAMLVQGFFGVFDQAVLLRDYLPYTYLMCFPEAFFTCGLLTMAVVYRPEWVYSFRDERYLDK